MPKCLFERASGLYAEGTRYDDIPHDSATHIQLTLADYPDRRAERWDGAAGVRPVTQAELDAFDAALLDQQAQSDIDDKKIKAVVAWVADRFGIPRSQARDEIIEIYKALP